MPLRTLIVVAGLLWPAAKPAVAQHGDPPREAPPRVYSTAPIAASAAQSWQADLDVLVQGLERVHPDPYWRTPEARFDSAVRALRDSIPRLAAHRIVIGFARILALVGDGHTSLPLYAARGVDFHVLPLRLGVYENGIYVEAADRAYRELVGGRLVSIGGVPAAQALARVA